MRVVRNMSFRNCGLSELWVVGNVDCGLSEIWVVGNEDCGLSDMWVVGTVGYQYFGSFHKLGHNSR